MAHDVFISHSSKDRKIAFAVCATLEQRQIRCWIAPRDIIAGTSYGKAIIEGINGTRLLVLVLTSHANNSKYVHKEVERAVNRGLPIIPFRLEEIELAEEIEFFISSEHWLDAMTPPLEARINELADTVEVLLNRINGKPGEKKEKELPDVLLIEDFDAGMLRPNKLGGSTLVFQENADPLSLKALFSTREDGQGRALQLAFDFNPHPPYSPVPPKFVGYATRLTSNMSQPIDWTDFVKRGYFLCFDARTDGSASSINIEIKRLLPFPNVDPRIVLWQVELNKEWERKCFKLSDVEVPGAEWDNLWEICFVLTPENLVGPSGKVEIDNVCLMKEPV